MKGWQRYSIAILLGLALGVGGAWTKIRQGFSKGAIAIGVWRTSLNYGTTQTDAFTRASVAVRGLLALPSTETLYWSATSDSDGNPLSGSCTYTMSGGTIDARWWSVTYYDKAGYLVANSADIWSFSGASVLPQEKDGWTVTISPVKAGGHWLPSAKGQGFDLTLRMYNPGDGFRAAPEKAALPTLKKGECA